MKNKDKRRERGVVLFVMVFCVWGLLGMLGLAIDMGRTFIAKDEAHAFTDAAALGAAAKLNGGADGIAAAQAYVTNNLNKWHLMTSSFTGVVTEFSADNGATWQNAGAAGIDSKWVRVTAPSNTLSMTFIRAVGAPASLTVRAQTIAGAQSSSSYSQGAFPFAPIARNDTAPDFGYSFGEEITLLWPAAIGSNGKAVEMDDLCASDQNEAALNAVREGKTADRGYIMMSSAADIREAVEGDQMDYTITVGGYVQRTSGVKNTIQQSLEDRVDQDGDPNSEGDTTGYANYLASHASHPSWPLRRIVIVPIVSLLETAVDQWDAVVQGFAYVYLPRSQPNSPNKAKCGMYIGPADKPIGNTGSGSGSIRIIQ